MVRHYALVCPEFIKKKCAFISVNYDTFNQLRSKCAFISVNYDTFNQLDHELLLRKKEVYATRLSLSLSLSQKYSETKDLKEGES